MDLLLALLLQAAIAPEGADSARAPRLSYTGETAADAAPRPRINQGRSFRTDLNALDQSLAAESRQERSPPAAPARATPGQATGRVIQWNGAPARIINGQPHGIW
ncbi:hypothetical protein [Sphingosinicella sp.]|uniref:hypothetical protein n=1 Tax=Sphingosinicella sp. TaxID=1917971 RepID=UPI0040376E54